MRPRDQLPYLEWKDGAVVRRVYADVWESEDLDAPSLITENAVESGARVTDHIRLEPITFSCRMFFSEVPIRGDLDRAHPGKAKVLLLPVPAYPNNTPLLSPAGITGVVRSGLAAAGEALGIISGPPDPREGFALQFDDPPGRLREFLATLLELRGKRTLFAVGLSVLRIESCGLQNVRIARSSEDGDSGALDLSFRQLEFVNSETAEALPLPLQPRGQMKKGVDGQKASDIDQDTAKGSAIAGAIESAGGTAIAIP